MLPEDEDRGFHDEEFIHMTRFYVHMKVIINYFSYTMEVSIDQIVVHVDDLALAAHDHRILLHLRFFLAVIQRCEEH